MSSVDKTLKLGTLLQQFFTHYLQEQRDVSQCTVIAYRDTFRLLLETVTRIYVKLFQILPMILQKDDRPIAPNHELG